MSWTKEKRQQYNREWYSQNKKKHIENCTQIVICECGFSLPKSNLPTHRNTDKHKRLIEIQDLEKKLSKITKKYKKYKNLYLNSKND